MQQVGYAFLKARLALSAFPVKKPAVVAPVNRIMTSLGGEALHVPAHVAPGSEDTLEHVLFALKHEGTNLQMLAEALFHVPVNQLLDRFRKSPNSIYLRKACYLFEALTVKDPVASAMAIARLQDEPDFAERLGRNARVKACAQFDEGIVIEKTLAVYRELLAVS